MQLTIRARGERQPSGFPLKLDVRSTSAADDQQQAPSVDDVARALHAKLPRYTPERQRLTVDKTTLLPGHLLAEYNIRDGDTLLFKDLGPQVGWRFVFVVEYLGPLLLHPLIYFNPQLFYGVAVEHSSVQTLALVFAVLHFLKREYESLFVHRFSHGTMPLRNIFKNSAHYHIFGGVLLAYSVYGPNLALGQPAAQRSEVFLYACVAVWTFAQVSNFITHMKLRNLRPPGSKIRQIPRGYGFDWVTCPNYLFESLGWLVYALLTMTWAAWLFFAISFGQMYVWAVKKHKAYRNEFPDYPRGRKAIIPFIV